MKLVNLAVLATLLIQNLLPGMVIHPAPQGGEATPSQETSTATPLPTETIIPSETPFVTETSTATAAETPTETAVPSETPTPTAAATTTPELVSGYRLTLQAEPSFAVYGGQVQTIWQIEGPLETGLVLRLHAPAGFLPLEETATDAPAEATPTAEETTTGLGITKTPRTPATPVPRRTSTPRPPFTPTPTPTTTPSPEAAQGWDFDEETYTLTLLNPAPRGFVRWEVSEDAEAPFLIIAELARGEEILAQATLLLTEEWQTTVNAETGGEAVGLRGRVRVTFDRTALKGVTSRPLTMRIRSLQGSARLPYSLSGHPFELLAEEQGTRRGVHQFKGKVRIQVAYDEGEIRGDESMLTLFYFDEKLQEWMPLPSMVDTEANLLTGYSDHFSVFDFDVQNWEAARLPSLQAFQVSSFTGAATYSFPIQLPPGPGGLQPSLTLSYNSQTVDSVGSKTQASWVGMGWSLDVGYIQRNMNGTPTYYGNYTFWGAEQPDQDWRDPGNAPSMAPTAMTPSASW